MRQTNRKLLGTFGIIALVIVYPLAIASLLGGMLASLPAWGSIPLFAILGLLWFYPASVVIRWMSKPDA